MIYFVKKTISRNLAILVARRPQICLRDRSVLWNALVTLLTVFADQDYLYRIRIRIRLMKKKKKQDLDHNLAHTRA
jgi:hypothetical protein